MTAYVLSNVVGIRNMKAADQIRFCCLTRRTDGYFGKIFHEIYDHVLQG